MDGINPCAFGVLLFFIAFLYTLKRTKGNILKIGVVYISMIYLAYLLIGLGIMQAIAISGVLMRHFYKVEIISVKELTMGLVSFQPVVPEGIGFVFFAHVFFVSVLFAYFPFSKLMHLGGVFMSPTRNLVNNSRAKRHVNPWNYEVRTHTYEEYEDELRDKMKAAGVPVERE